MIDYKEADTHYFCVPILHNSNPKQSKQSKEVQCIVIESSNPEQTAATLEQHPN